MARQRQPDNIFLTFKNVETLSGDNNLNYFYREVDRPGMYAYKNLN